MPRDTDAMSILGELICRLNPYTNNPKPGTQAEKTGDMEIATLPPPASVVQSDPGFSSIAVEVERNYPAQWDFKGQAQRINTAVRIPYRFPVQDRDGNALYWVTEYLLIGFVGAGGGA